MDKNVFLQSNEAKRTKPVIFTRTMGYYRPVEYFNDGKVGEHKERKHFTTKRIHNMLDTVNLTCVCNEIGAKAF